MADHPPSRPAPALVISCAFGVLGLVLIVVGAITDSELSHVLGATAGALSLGAALYWRSQLIAAWGERRRAQGKR